MEVVKIPISEIDRNKNQPRQHFNPSSLDELAQSIKENGLLQPIHVRRISQDHYELIAGERRLKACQQLGYIAIKAIVNDQDQKNSALLAVIENIQRDDLHFIEEAYAYQKLIDSYGMKQDELAKKVAKSQSTIANKLRILKLNEQIIKIIEESGLSERHARALLKVDDVQVQVAVVKHCVKKALSVKETEKYIQRLLAKEEETEDDLIMKRYLKDIRLFTNTIKQAVDMMKESGIEANYKIKDQADHYCITIDIPKGGREND